MCLPRYAAAAESTGCSLCRNSDSFGLNHGAATYIHQCVQTALHSGRRHAVLQLRDFLGVQADDPKVAQLLQAQHLPYRIAPVADRGTVAFAPANGEAYTVEEHVVRCGAHSRVAPLLHSSTRQRSAATCPLLLTVNGTAASAPMQASLLHYAKGLGQAAADGQPVVDTVITVSSPRQAELQRDVRWQTLCRTSAADSVEEVLLEVLLRLP